MSAHPLLDPAVYARREEHAVFRSLRRAHGPVAPLGARSWAVLGHAEARAVLTDPALYSSAQGTRTGIVKTAAEPASLNQLDPPAHTSLRALADRPLAARELARVTRFVRARARSLVEAALRSGRFDAIARIAHPLALASLGAWLGLGGDDTEALGAAVERSHAAGLARLDPTAPAQTLDARTAAAQDAKRALHALCARWLDPRAALESAPGALAALRLAVHTQRCAEPQARGLAVLFAEAGYVTARDALGNALVAYLEDPARARWLRRHRARRASVARFVEESLRYDPPVVQFARTATRDAALRGSAVCAGDRVLVFFAAANRDPSVYSQPDRFDPTRTPSAHLALGAGPHRCPGASLARAQLRAVFDALAHEAPSLQHDAPPTRRASNYLAGYERVPVLVLP